MQHCDDLQHETLSYADVDLCHHNLKLMNVDNESDEFNLIVVAFIVSSKGWSKGQVRILKYSILKCYDWTLIRNHLLTAQLTDQWNDSIYSIV
jgi:hypothetical protein